MPFLIRPPLHTIETDSSILAHIVIEPDHNERTILRDLQAWGWRITRHDFNDAEFVDTIVAIERDVKKRRRQTHAIAGELHGYCERLTLEQVWEKEAERALGEDAYGPPVPTPGQQNVRSFRDSDLEDREKVIEDWLRAITRTRQTTAFLDATDPNLDYPRLIDHHTNPPRRPARLQYQSDPSQPHTHTTTKPLPQIPYPRSHQNTNKRLPLAPTKPICPLFPSRFFEHIPTTTPSPSHSPLARTHASPTPSYIPSLPFPSAPSTPRTYTRLTRRGLARSKKPVVAPGGGDNAYGWDSVSVNKTDSKRGVRAQCKFFVRRERGGLVQREQQGRKMLGEEVVRRRGVEEMYAKGRAGEKDKGGEKIHVTDGDNVLMSGYAWHVFGLGE